MKIVVLAPYSRPFDTVEAEGSGMNQYIRESSIALAEAGHEVTVYIRQSRPRDTDSKVHKNLNLVHVAAGDTERLTRIEVYNAIESSAESFKVPHDTDLVIAHYWISVPWIQALAGSYYGRVLYCSHALSFNPDRESFQKEALLAESSILQRATWLANSSFEYKTVASHTCEENLRLIFPGITLPDKYSKTDTSDFLFIGRKTKAKGYDLFCEAAKQLPDKKFLSVGRSGDVKELKQPNLTSIDHVTLKEAYSYIKNSNTVVCPSRYEHFGFVPLAATLLSTRVVATPVGVVNDLIGMTNHTFTIVEAKTESLLSAMRNIEELKECKKKTVAEVYSWENWVKEVVKLSNESFNVYKGLFADVTMVPKKIDDQIVWCEITEMPGSIHVIPTDGETYGFVNETRIHNPQSSTRVLSGSIEKNELPELAAARELEEETGLIAENLELFYETGTLGTIVDKRYYFLAHGCKPIGTKKTDRGEKIHGLEYLTKEQIIDRLKKDQLGSAFTSLALAKLCGIL